jgi:hypothetical protein
MNCMVSNADVVLQVIISAHERKFESKNFANSFAGLIMNYSSGFVQKPIDKGEVLVMFLKLVAKRLEVEK